MNINKLADNKECYRNKVRYYESAREAMKEFVQALTEKGKIKTILLPGYIGWSPKEGSGIFDAINKIPFLKRIYYKMDQNLQVDKRDLEEKLSIHDDVLVLLVNYFGFRDLKYLELCELIKKYNGRILEDNAHGLYTYWFGEKCMADATFFSYHKMLPISYGGGIKVLAEDLQDITLGSEKNYLQDFCEWNYDLKQIAEKRVENYKILHELIINNKMKELVQPLKDIKELEENIPQTYPVKILKGNRNEIYERMNQQGFGVVSLYHTMIEELNKEEYSEAKELSRVILNLPVHQDVNTDYYNEMIEVLYECCMEGSKYVN